MTDIKHCSAKFRYQIITNGLAFKVRFQSANETDLSHWTVFAYHCYSIDDARKFVSSMIENDETDSWKVVE